MLGAPLAWVAVHPGTRRSQPLMVSRFVFQWDAPQRNPLDRTCPWGVPYCSLVIYIIHPHIYIYPTTSPRYSHSKGLLHPLPSLV